MPRAQHAPNLSEEMYHIEIEVFDVTATPTCELLAVLKIDNVRPPISHFQV